MSEITRSDLFIAAAITGLCAAGSLDANAISAKAISIAATTIFNLNKQDNYTKPQTQNCEICSRVLPEEIPHCEITDCPHMNNINNS